MHRPNRWRGRTAAVCLLLATASLVVAACSSAAEAPVARDGGEAARPGRRWRPRSRAQDQAGFPGSRTRRGTSGGDGPDNLVNPDQPLIVKTGTLQLEVADVPKALADAKAAIAALGGYVSGSQESNERDQPVAQITYRIPADRWDDALAALRGLATKVVSEQTRPSR